MHLCNRYSIMQGKEFWLSNCLPAEEMYFRQEFIRASGLVHLSHLWLNTCSVTLVEDVLLPSCRESPVVACFLLFLWKYLSQLHPLQSLPPVTQETRDHFSWLHFAFLPSHRGHHQTSALFLSCSLCLYLTSSFLPKRWGVWIMSLFNGGWLVILIS